jgi:competence protein ComFC
MTRTWSEIILNFLFPRRCVACSRWENYLCTQCITKVEYLDQQYCPSCHQVSPMGLNCHGCKKTSYLDQIYSVCWYRGVVRSLISEFKYEKGVQDISSFAKVIIANRLSMDELSFWRNSFVTAVPLNWQRRNERGFNQSEELARGLADLHKLKYRFDLLKRLRNTDHQAWLKKNERDSNVKHAFDVGNPRDNLRSAEVILVDDVFTTGSTMNECARILKVELGIGKVYGFTFTRG